MDPSLAHLQTSLIQDRSAISHSMFPVAEIQNQADKDSFSSDSSNVATGQIIPGFNLEDFQFLDHLTLPEETAETDWLSVDMEPLEELSIDSNQVMEFPEVFLSDLPAEELSLDLNAISSLIPDFNILEDVFPTTENTSDHSVIEKEVNPVTEEPFNDSVNPATEEPFGESVNPATQEPFEESVNPATEEPFEESVSDSESTSSSKTSHRLKSEELTPEVAGKKYLEMRRKNNIASQRSRKLRKQKDSETAHKLEQLENENKQLSLLCSQLEMERDTLKSVLVKIMSKK